MSDSSDDRRISPSGNEDASATVPGGAEVFRREMIASGVPAELVDQWIRDADALELLHYDLGSTADGVIDTLGLCAGAMETLTRELPRYLRVVQDERDALDAAVRARQSRDLLANRQEDEDSETPAWADRINRLVRDGAFAEVIESGEWTHDKPLADELADLHLRLGEAARALERPCRKLAPVAEMWGIPSGPLHSLVPENLLSVTTLTALQETFGRLKSRALVEIHQEEARSAGSDPPAPAGTPGATDPGLPPQRARPARVDAEDQIRSQFRFVKEGEYWELRFASEAGRFKHRTGFDLLNRLLRWPHPTRPLTPTDLQGRAAATREDQDSVQPAVDELGKEQIEARLRQLEHEIEEARGRGDGPEAAELGDEHERLTKHLAKSTFRGKAKAINPTRAAESDRVAVKRAVDRAITAIEASMPRLAEHLRASVRTSAACEYRPATPVAWEFE